MIEFLYLGPYTQVSSDLEGEDGGNTNCSTFNAIVFKIADKYDLTGLAELASSRFQNAVQSDFQAPAFAETVREVFGNGPDNPLGRSMRRGVFDSLLSIEEQLTSEPRYVDLWTAMKEVPIFGIEFQKASLEKATERCTQLQIAALSKARELDETIRARALVTQQKAMAGLSMRQRQEMGHELDSFLEERRKHQDSLALLTQYHVNIRAGELRKQAEEKEEHRSFLDNMSFQQRSKWMWERDEESGVGFCEKRFRCASRICNQSFVALMKVESLKCPYCGTAVRS